MSGVKVDNLYNLLKEKFIPQRQDDTIFKLLEEICRRFVLVPAEDFSPHSNIFHNLEIGFLQERLTREEIDLYKTLWAAQVESWRSITDEPMGAFEMMLLDNTIMLFVKCRRLSGADMKLDVSAGSAGWVADQLLQKGVKLVYDVFPKRKTAAAAAKEKAPARLMERCEEAAETEDLKKTTYYVWKKKEMTQDQYDTWYNSLSEQEKADVLPHIKTVTK